MRCWVFTQQAYAQCATWTQSNNGGGTIIDPAGQPIGSVNTSTNPPRAEGPDGELLSSSSGFDCVIGNPDGKTLRRRRPNYYK